jgi:hypothetical protein
MLLKQLRWLWIVVLSLAGVLIVQAQALTQPVEIGDGYTVLVPSNWEVDVWEVPDSRLEGVQAERRRDVVRLLAPSLTSELFDGDAPSDLRAAARTAFRLVTGDGMGSSDMLSTQTLGEYLVAQVTSRNGDVLALVDVGADGLLLAQYEGNDPDLFDEILASLTKDESATAAPTAAAAEPCTISTDNADTVNVRVGPGNNRGVINFLPSGESYAVTGRFEDSDGGIWYQLDRATVFPRSAAAEAWVFAEDVDAVGDCDQVGSADAPPLILAPVAVPTAAPVAPGQPVPTVEAGSFITPRAGTWTLTMDASTQASCVGGSTVNLSTVALFGQSGFRGNLSMRSDGSSLVYDGATLNRTSPNNYLGATLIGGDSVQIVMQIRSADSISGQLIFTFFEPSINRNCSSTTQFQMRPG